jgi:hypothetical protein
VRDGQNFLGRTRVLQMESRKRSAAIRLLQN